MFLHCELNFDKIANDTQSFHFLNYIIFYENLLI